MDFTVSVDTSPRTATRLAKISGDDQSGFTGAALVNPFVVEVRDQFDDPLAGAAVTFAVTAGSGALSATSPARDAKPCWAAVDGFGSEPGGGPQPASADLFDLSLEGSIAKH